VDLDELESTAERAPDIPVTLPDRDRLFPDPQEWVDPDDSVVVAPGGTIVAGPPWRQHDILYADIDVARVAQSRRRLDVVGHHARPDVFQLTVRPEPQTPCELVE
jgi:nitrilase